MKTPFAKPHEEPIIVAPLHVPKPKAPLSALAKKAGKKGDEDDGGSELFDGKNFKAPSNAKLVYRGGPLLTHTQIYTIFWGANWNTKPDLKAIMAGVNAFFKAIMVSPLIDQLKEYNVPAYSIGHGSLLGTKNITAAPPVTSITDTTIRSTLQSWIHAGTVPANTNNILYFIYFEPNIKVSMQGSASCTSFCGYHSNIGNNLFYAVMPYPSCSGCLGGLPTPLDALTGTSSHELCEAITDPIPGNGWYDNHNGEIGDICAWTFKKVAGYTVQKEWSNAAKKCV